MEQMSNFENRQRKQWYSVLKSLRNNAYVIGICAIAMQLIPMMFGNVGSSANSYEAIMGSLVGLSIIIFAAAIISYVVQWIQVSNLEQWLIYMDKDDTYKGINRYRKGCKLSLMCVLFVIAVALLALVFGSMVNSPSGADIFAIVLIIAYIAIVIVAIIALVYIVMGAWGLAFSNNVDKNISNGMKFIIASWGVNILLAIINYGNTMSVNTLEEAESAITIMKIMPILYTIVPVLQIIGWRNITMAEYPKDKAEN